jgi:hypothetical protein
MYFITRKSQALVFGFEELADGVVILVLLLLLMSEDARYEGSGQVGRAL